MSLGQTTSWPAVDSPEYQAQKLAGTLEGSSPGGPVQEIPGNVFPGSGGSVSPLAGCACYTEPDATWNTLNLCDDCSSGLINLPFNICFYGSTANSLYINANGNVSFNSPYSTFSPPPLPSAGQAIIGPFWADVDMSNGTVGKVRYKVTPTAIYVNWVNVGFYPANGSLRNTFSVIITNGNDASIGIGNNVAFCYKDMQWTTGSASGGSGGFGGIPATVGANWGTGGQFIRIGTFNAPGNTYNGPNVVSQVGWLKYKSFKFNVCNNVNAPPVLIGANVPGYTFQPDTCNAVNGGVILPIPGAPGICVGQTVSGSLTFTGPESNQQVTVSAATIPGLTITGTSGSTATLSFTYTPPPGTNGPQTFVVMAQDNGIPIGSTNIPVTLYVTEPPYYPTITGPDNICPGGTAGLSVAQTFDTYIWSGAAAGNTQNITGPNGVYNVTVKIGGCTLTASKTVGLFTPPVPVISGNNRVCAGQTSVLSTTIPYTNYQWSTGDMTPVAHAGTGTHTVQVTDANGCRGTSQPFTVTEYTAPVIQATPGNVSCRGLSDGSLMVLVGGATGNETIVWAHDPSETSFTATGLAAGTYTFTVTDANGCTWPGSGTVTEPQPLQLAVQTVNVTCPGGNNGSATGTATGGTAPYTYTWNNVGNGTGTSAGYTQGTYTVSVTDAHGCTVQDQFTLTETSTTPSFSSTSVIESCPGASNGSINLTVSGGNPAFTFLWNNGDTAEDPQQLAAGHHSVTVTDVNGCPFSYSADVGVGANLELNYVKADVLCHGNLTGSILIQPVTGIAPFTVLMNGVPASLHNMNLGAGHYSFYLTDVNGCYFSFESTVTQPTALVVDSTYDRIGLGDVVNLHIAASGGVPPYAYQWTPASYLSCTDCTSPLCYAVHSTAYTIAVTDANGCVSQGRARVEIDDSPIFAPASFTPNGDGLNETFLVSIAGVKNFEMRIFSRWGDKVFESDDIYKGWDGKVNGKPVESGMYVYKIYVRLINGNEKEFHGNLTILR